MDTARNLVESREVAGPDSLEEAVGRTLHPRTQSEVEPWALTAAGPRQRGETVFLPDRNLAGPAPDTTHSPDSKVLAGEESV